jgi:4a-hydroxytetrahydrobiopterin dehydratase
MPIAVEQRAEAWDPGTVKPAAEPIGERVSERIGAKAFHESEGTQDWRVLGDGAYAFFRTSSLAESVRFVDAIAALPEIAANPPDLDVRKDGVTVRRLTTDDDYYGMTTDDVEIARNISEAARALGLSSDPTVSQSLLIVPGAPNVAEVLPFWRAVLGYDLRPDSPEEDIVDRHDRTNDVWFEEMQEPRGDGGGAIHIGVFVAREEAESRIAAALAVGGRLVRDRSPMWWTLADAAGNEADIATTEGRG